MKEIERKFLVKNSDWIHFVDRCCRIKQGYLCVDENKIIRVRINETNRNCFLTIKSNSLAERIEIETEITLTEANFLMYMTVSKVISKVRYYLIDFGNFKEVVVDVFENGLVLAEFEFNSLADYHSASFPDWVDKEVTDDPSYYNHNLAT